MAFTIDVDMENLQKVAGSLEGIPDRLTELAALDLESHLRRNSSKGKTGQLQAKWRSERRGSGQWAVGTPVKYAEYVDTGTRPHTPPMKPIKEWAEFRGLPWFPIWLSIVRRGTKAHPYLDRSIQETNRRIPLFINQAIREAMI